MIYKTSLYYNTGNSECINFNFNGFNVCNKRSRILTIKHTLNLCCFKIWWITSAELSTKEPHTCTGQRNSFRSPRFPLRLVLRFAFRFAPQKKRTFWSSFSSCPASTSFLYESSFPYEHKRKLSGEKHMSNSKPWWRGRSAGSRSIDRLKRTPDSPCVFLDYGLSFPTYSGQF